MQSCELSLRQCAKANFSIVASRVCTPTFFRAIAPSTDSRRNNLLLSTVQALKKTCHRIRSLSVSFFGNLGLNGFEASRRTIFTMFSFNRDEVAPAAKTIHSFYAFNFRHAGKIGKRVQYVNT